MCTPHHVHLLSLIEPPQDMFRQGPSVVHSQLSSRLQIYHCMSPVVTGSARLRQHTHTMRVTLDAAMYPHILSMIMAESSHSTLLALRTASREVRRQVDGILAQHVCLQILDPRFIPDDLEEPGHLSPVSVFSPRGRLPLFMGWESEADDCDRRTAALQSLRYTRVFDLVGIVGNLQVLPLLAGMGKRLRAIRVRRGEDGRQGWVGCREIEGHGDLDTTYIDFTTLGTHSDRIHINEENLGKPLMPPFATRSIRTIAYEPNRYLQLYKSLGPIFAGSVRVEPNLATDTIIFLPLPSPTRNPLVRHNEVEESEWDGIVRDARHDLGMLIAACGIKVKNLTVVNMLGLATAFSSDIKESIFEEVQRRGEADWRRWVTELEAERLAAMEDPTADIPITSAEREAIVASAVQNLHKSITFLTLDEYRRKVGENEFALAVHENLGLIVDN